MQQREEQGLQVVVVVQATTNQLLDEVELEPVEVELGGQLRVQHDRHRHLRREKKQLEHSLAHPRRLGGCSYFRCERILEGCFRYRDTNLWSERNFSWRLLRSRITMVAFVFRCFERK